MSNQPQTPDTPQSGVRMKAFLTGAILGASALIGGLAVVLWNRKALSGLRQHHEPDQTPSPEADVEEG